jgi:hypothetical protein
MAGTQRLKVYAVQGENRAQAVVRGKIEVPHHYFPFLLCLLELAGGFCKRRPYPFFWLWNSQNWIHPLKKWFFRTQVDTWNTAGLSQNPHCPLDAISPIDKRPCKALGRTCANIGNDFRTR